MGYLANGAVVFIRTFTFSGKGKRFSQEVRLSLEIIPLYRINVMKSCTFSNNFIKFIKSSLYYGLRQRLKQE